MLKQICFDLLRCSYVKFFFFYSIPMESYVFWYCTVAKSYFSPPDNDELSWWCLRCRSDCSVSSSALRPAS